MEDIKKLNEVFRKVNEVLRGQTTYVVNRGIGPLSLLGVALVVLKAMGYISISWFWALTPFWLPIILALFLVFATLLIAVLSYKAYKGIEIVVEKEEKIENTSTEETPVETLVESAPTPAKSRRRKSKKKKEEVNNGESKESTDTRAEIATNK